MVAVSFVCALCGNHMEQLSKAVLDGADKAVELVISMAGVMSLWTGIMKIADRGGLTAIISKLLSPILSKLMPDYDSDSAAMKAVSANITANILGLGNAATPFGIAAMKEMQKTNKNVSSPNNSMIIFGGRHLQRSLSNIYSLDFSSFLSSFILETYSFNVTYLSS